MMAVLELYGKCKELGYCDCSGFFGCVDPRPPAPKPVIENELATAMKAEQEVSYYHNHDYRRELEAIDQSQGALVECEVCDRSHLPNHPHISNIEGDTPFDDDEPVQRKADPIISLPPPDDQLPEWLRDRPAEEVTEDDKPRQICQVCGNPWAPRHACIGKEAPGARAFNGRVSKSQSKCDACGKIKRSNHDCKAQPKADAAKVALGCDNCKRAGELCVRHGGVWLSYDTAKGQPEKAADERIALELPKPVSVVMPKPAEPAPDRELVAMGAIVEAVRALGQPEIKRILDYVAARFGGGDDAS
jgi:hypothetical protein